MCTRASAFIYWVTKWRTGYSLPRFNLPSQCLTIFRTSWISFSNSGGAVIGHTELLQTSQGLSCFGVPPDIVLIPCSRKLHLPTHWPVHANTIFISVNKCCSSVKFPEYVVSINLQRDQLFVCLSKCWCHLSEPDPSSDENLLESYRVGKCIHTSISLFVLVLELCCPSVSLSHEYVPMNVDLWINGQDVQRLGPVKHYCHLNFRNLFWPSAPKLKVSLRATQVRCMASILWKAQTAKKTNVFWCSSKRAKMCECDSSSWHIHF